MTKSIKTCEELSKNTTKAAKYLKLVTSEEHHAVVKEHPRIKHINITNASIIKGMSDETKHNFANCCIANRIEPEEVIETITKIANIAINCSIDLCNKYFETSAGKEYLNMRKRIDRIGK
jgi:hypothetical protein